MRAIAVQQKNDLTEAQREQIGTRVALDSNLWGMPDADVWAYYRMMCVRLKLDPLSHPFDVITDQKQQSRKLYPNHLCTSQLGESQGYTYGKVEVEADQSLAALGFKVAKVTVQITAPGGRSLTGEAFIDLMSGWEGKALAGNNLVNALKKAATQARRRGTLQMAGLAIPPDSYEVATLGEIERADGQGILIEHPPARELMPGDTATDENLANDADRLTPTALPTPSNDPLRQVLAEESALNNALLGYCKTAKGEKNGQAFFTSQYSQKTLDQKRELAKSLGLHVAWLPGDDGKAALIETIDSLYAELNGLRVSNDEILKVVSRLAKGEIGLPDMDAETLITIRAELDTWRADLMAAAKREAA